MISNIKWDEETDVIIAGYGLAGGVAALEACAAGAEVILIEKSNYAGGCSILSGGMILCAQDVEAAAQYLAATSGERVDDSLIQAFARDLAGNEEHLKKLASPYNAKITTTKAHEAGVRDEDGYVLFGYPYPGYETFYRAGITELPGFSGFKWVQRLQPAGVNLMKVIFDSVEARPAKVLFSTPARRLVTDSAGEVIGVIASQDGKEIAFKARRAVILACGGFEQNEWLLKQYLQGTPFYSMAPTTHTGDGILMAQKVGAALWHMWHVHASYGFKFDEFPIAFRTTFRGARNTKRIMPWIVTDKFGNRYMNEYHPAPQDTNHRAMEIFDPDMPGYSRIPSYIIFDEEGRKHGPLGHPLAIGEDIYQWSRDNLKEIAKGWILKEDSIHKLALRIRETKDNEDVMEPDTLEATISQWNRVVGERKDPFQRPPKTMMPIKVPPFYAAPVWPIISNTQGGPQHNVNQQVMDPFGEPIPRLYTAGELGSFWSHVYLLAGNLGECLSSGRIAGRNASAEHS